jgi:hypothetical protein
MFARPTEATRHGLSFQLEQRDGKLILIAVADVSEFKRSHSYWEQMVHSNPPVPFEKVADTAAYMIESQTSVTFLHELFKHVPSASSVHTKLKFNSVNESHAAGEVGLEFDYTRAVDAAKYRDDDPSTVDVIKDTTNTGLAPWLANALAQESGSLGRILKPDDILLDKDSLKGQTVDVRGFTACNNSVEMCTLYTSADTFTKNIFYDASVLNREDRSKLLSCTIFTGCDVTIRGRVVDEPLKMIVVTGLGWGDGPINEGYPAAEPSANINSPITVKDYILDRSSYLGKAITVAGKAQCDGSSCWLTEIGSTSQQNATFSADTLPRDDRKRLLDCDQAFSTGCDVEVTGQVAEANLVASSVVWK